MNEETPISATAVANNSLPDVITSEALKTQPTIALPETPTQTTPNVPVQSSIAENLLKQYDLSKTEQEAKDLQGSNIARALENLSNLKGESAFRTEKLAEAGVDNLRKELLSITNKKQKLQAEVLQDDIKLIQQVRAEENRDTLLPFAQLGQAKIAGDAQIVRALKNSEIMMLDVSALAKQGEISLAREMVDEAVNAKFAPYKEQNELYKQQLELIKPYLDSAEKKQAAKQEIKLNMALKEIDRVSDFQKTILNNAISNNAPQSVLSAINKATTVDEVVKAGGGFLQNAKEKLELQKIRGDIALNSIQYQKILQDINDARAVIQGTTGDPALDVILGSTRYGKQNLSEGQLEKIQQATGALSSLESLQALLSQGKDGISTTGPLKGKLRQVLTLIGKDASAAAVNATIQGLIPTVARGVFGEVGVLTDADIANYKKTLPNLTSSEDQNKLVSVIMYDVLSRSVGNVLMTNAQNQVNVSNFASTYANTKNTVNRLKSELGVVETVPVSPENQAKMESAWEATSVNASDALNNFLK